MSRDDETESPKRKRKGASVMAWLLMAMLVAGLGGYGVTSYGTGNAAIATVGEREISVNDYARALQTEMNVLGEQIGGQISMAQAQNLGLDARARQQLIMQAGLDNLDDRIGLSVGDSRVASEITAMPAFRGASGTFDRQAYSFTLDRSNLTRSGFEAKVRDDLARSVLQGAVSGGFIAPASFTDTIYGFIGERRSFTILQLTQADLSAPLPDPDETALKAHYDANIAAFTRPEAKRITYVTLLPEALAATMPVDDAGLRALYDQRADEYLKPERRLVERLVFGTEDEAKAAKARIDAGESFESLVAERGLKLMDIDLGDVSQQDLGQAGAAVFALAEPGVIGPLPTDLGPALFRMNAVLAAQETTFDEAKADLTVEYQMDAARRAISDKIEAVDDALAGGATLEDLTREQAMELGVIDYSAATSEGIAGYPAFREAADAVQPNDFPEAIQLDDGGLVALRLDEIVPATPIPFEEARDAVTESWRRLTLQTALAARAAEIRAAVENGAALDTFGAVSTTAEITRDGFVENAPEMLLPTVFQMTEGETRVIEAPDYVALARLDRIIPAATEGEGPEALKAAIAAQVEQAISQDALALFSFATTNDAGISINQMAIDAVHTQLP